MTDQYDSIGERWETSTTTPVFAALLTALRTLAGDVGGLDVLDVACGTGVHARQWADGGARRVVGTDRSVEMIAAAREVERARPSGIEYRVADATDHPVLGPFDLVTAAFLLNYARDEHQMAAMAGTLHDNLRPGGRLVGILPEPDWRSDGPPPNPLGIHYDVREAIGVGVVLGAHLHTEPPIEFEAVLARRDAYEDGLARAGFAAPRWIPVRDVLPDAADLWTANPPVVLYEAVRPA